MSLGATKLRVLLATLLLSPNRTVPSDVLYERLWGADLPAQPRRAAQVYVTRLRHGLGAGGAVRTTPGGYAIEVTPDQLDLLRFRDLLAQAEHSDSDTARASLLTQALELWHGPACLDIQSEALAVGELHQLNEQRLLAEEQRADAELRLGLYTRLVPRLTRLTAETPLRERFWAQLIIALHGAGRKAEALLAYQKVAALLADELGVDPGEEIRSAQLVVLRDKTSCGR